MTDKEEEIKRKAFEAELARRDLGKIYRPVLIDWRDDSEFSKASKIKKYWKTMKGTLSISTYPFTDQEARKKAEAAIDIGFLGFFDLFSYANSIQKSTYSIINPSGVELRQEDKELRKEEFDKSKRNYQIACSLHIHSLYDSLIECGLEHNNAHALCEKIIVQARNTHMHFNNLSFQNIDLVDRYLLDRNNPPRKIIDVIQLDGRGNQIAKKEIYPNEKAALERTLEEQFIRGVFFREVTKY